MLPHEHFLLACLPVVGYVALRHRRFPSKRVLGAVLLGSLMPDLIDKPLAYQLELIPHGRVFLHSLPIIIPVVTVVLIYAWATDRLRMGLGYAVGHLLHPLGDFQQTILAGTIPQPLLWPFVSAPSGTDPIWIHDWTIVSVIVLIGVVLWLVADLRTQLRAHCLQKHSCNPSAASRRDRSS